MKLFMLITLSFCVLYSQVIHGFVINDFDGPELVTLDKNAYNKTIDLDCDYELSSSVPYLLVKWFMNNKLIYQWIRGKQPSVLPLLRDYIELRKTSDDPNHEYSSLTLNNISIELNGTYKCSVNAGSEYKSVEKEVHIVDLRQYEIEFHARKVQNETHLECIVNNIFPKPIINMVSNDPDAIILKDNPSTILRDNSYFNVTQTAVASNAESEESFDCFVSFESLPFNISAREVAAQLEAGTDSATLIVNPHVVVYIFVVISTLLMF
ncbi:uncharacterized protein LOC133327272 [Musca vetustissima]|uniref:uncharacterized protein LOC133327272 n=1 Tax=Musca vetustissima TaxID=27455 RepID=UPI002AB650EA|nr:uncharacterized protein LOC133327272 [Musca vetustissima]